MSDKAKYNPSIHHRHSIRLKGYDYSREGLYFITICCHNRAHLFGKVVDGAMVLNEYGQVAFNEWMKTPEVRPNVELGEFVVMPNHVHGIVRITVRGELHSPYNEGESHSPNCDGESSNGESSNGESHSSHGESYSSDCRDVLNTPYSEGDNKMGENISPDYKGEFNSPQPYSPQPYSPQRYSSQRESPLRGPSQTIGAIVRGYKSAVTKKLNELGVGRTVWQRDYWDHIIRDEQSYYNISKYIENNPSKWNDDKFFMR